jgi:hypothetical protein
MTLGLSRHPGSEWTRFRDDYGYGYDYEAGYPNFDFSELPGRRSSENWLGRPQAGHQQIVYSPAVTLRLFSASQAKPYGICIALLLSPAVFKAS